MSADFWAGYISGAAGILIGNPLDLIKVRLQATPPPSSLAFTTTTSTSSTVTTRQRLSNPFTTASSLIRGASAPILGYGALNAILFMTYNRSLAQFSSQPLLRDLSEIPSRVEPSLSATFVAGALGGLATWLVSTPTELIKCRAQLQVSAPAQSVPSLAPASTNVANSAPVQGSFGIAKQIFRAEGVRGLYFGGTVTALRDSIGYGFYFWSYEIMTRWMREKHFSKDKGDWSENGQEAAKILLCGGIAGVITWLSVFPLDVVKTRVQTQGMSTIGSSEASGLGNVSQSTPLLGGGGQTVQEGRLGAWDMTKRTYRAEGFSVFFRGLGVCSLRAFIVNAAQWAVYEWIMNELEPGRRKIQVDQHEMLMS